MGYSASQGQCTGRGFTDVNSDGFLKNLHDFVSGHADWSIVLDRSTYPSDVTASSVNTSTNQITATSHGFYNNERVRLIDTGSGVPSGTSTSATYIIKSIDANTVELYSSYKNYLAGSKLNLASDVSFDIRLEGPYILIGNGSITNANTAVELLKVGYEIHESGSIRIQWCFGYDPTNSEIRGYWDGLRLTTLDASQFNFDFRANDTGLFLIQSQVGGTWYSAGIDAFTPLTNFLETTSVEGTTQTSLSAGSDVTVQLANSTEADLFTSGNYYYIYDFRPGSGTGAGVLAVGYGQCGGVGSGAGLNADEIKFSTLNEDFPSSGAIVTPYKHTWVSITDGGTKTISDNELRYTTDESQLPYYSRTDEVAYPCIYDQDGIIRGSYNWSYDEQALLTGNPLDKGVYVVQKPLIVEENRPNGANVDTDMNRVYGELNNIYLSDDDGLSKMSVGRTINGKEYIAIGPETGNINGTSNIEMLVINEA